MAIRLAFIGLGNMGGAILRGAIDASVLRPDEILVFEPSADRQAEARSLGCGVAGSLSEVLSAEQIMLAVKPQMFPSVAQELGPVSPGTIVISIMAGLSSGRIRSALGDTGKVVRTMPNTPCQIGEGMTAISLGEGASSGDEQLAEQLFGSIGKTVMLDESLMYAVTAVSGSGPAYVFLLAESMQQAAEQMGISHATARTLVQQTIIGAGGLLRSTDQTAGQLRQAVTSPGGTTAAALEEMFEKDLPETVVEALMAARNRGIELDVESS